MNEVFFDGYRIKNIRAAHGGLEYVLQLDNGKFVITAADYRRIGETVLAVGNIVDDDVLEDITFSAEKLSCIQKALNHLEYAPMTEKKLKMKLRGKFSPEAIEAALDILKENGYIDDMRLALDLCDEYFVRCQMSPMKIKAKLYQRGFAQETVSNAFEEYDFSDETMFENMEILVSRKFGEITEENNRKALEYLLRQGYSYEISKSFVKLFD